jgi:hypothetical protein
VKVFWAWQSDHPREISRDVIRTALEAAIEHLKQERDVVEAPEESRGDLRLDHDTKGLFSLQEGVVYAARAAQVLPMGDVPPWRTFGNEVGWRDRAQMWSKRETGSLVRHRAQLCIANMQSGAEDNRR